jgi:predicted secreted Zn-dependent protease
VTLRIRPHGAWALLLASGAACADHSLATDPVPLDQGDAGIVLYASLTTYPVAGSDLQSLAMSVSGGGASPQGRQRFSGYHAWNITWKVLSRPQAGECAIAEALVFVDSRITLPDWDAPANSDPALTDQWRAFLLALHAHEAGHQALVMQGAERVRRTLLETVGPRCEPALAKADSAGQEVLASIREEDARYDAATRHGATQGAVWPPATGNPVVTVR